MRKLAVILSAACLVAPAAAKEKPQAKKTMKISSPAFINGAKLPSRYTCDGENVNPPLKIEEVPAQAKTLALVVDDPDAPYGTWTHWIVLNISTQTKEIAENSVPAKAFEARGDSGKAGYDGPCPPQGEHRYFFRLYALDSEIASAPSKEAALSAIKKHAVAQAEIMGAYSRK